MTKIIVEYDPKKRATYRVWPWDCAPEEFRILSPHGGDEDFVATVDLLGMWEVEEIDEDIPHIVGIAGFAVVEIFRSAVIDGQAVVIGAHA